MVTTPAQPNEQVERVKETSKKYVAFIKQYGVNPSRIFNTSENQVTNAIITIAIILLLASSTIFLVAKTFHTMVIESFTGNVFIDDFGDGLGSETLESFKSIDDTTVEVTTIESFNLHYPDKDSAEKSYTTVSQLKLVDGQWMMHKLMSTTVR